jgi:hypothetical protein
LAITFDANAVSAQIKSATTSIGLSANVAAGKVAFAIIAKDNTSTVDGNNNEVTSVVDNQGNIWEKQAEFTNGQGSAGTGATISLWKSKITTALSGANNLTFNFPSCTAKAVIACSFAVAAGNDLQLAAAPVTLAADAAGSQNLSISGLPSKQYLFIRLGAFEGPLSGAGFGTSSGHTYASLGQLGTSGGSANTNMSLVTAYTIATATGSNASVQCGTVDQANLYLAFEEYTPGGAPVDLTSQDIATSAPAVSQTTLGQTHVLTSAALATAAALLSATSIGQIHALNSSSITSPTPIVAASSIGQTHILTSGSLTTSAPILTPSTASIDIVYNFTSQGIELPAAIVGNSSLAQIHGLTSTNLATITPIISSANIGQIHNIISAGSPGSGELVFNGDFATDINGWSLTAGGLITFDNGKLKVTSQTADTYAETWQVINGPLAAGTYRMSGKITPSYQDYAMVSIIGPQLAGYVYALYNQEGLNFSVDFVLPTTGDYLTIFLDAANDENWTKAPNGEYATFDDISLIRLGVASIETSIPVISASSIAEVNSLVSLNLLTSTPIIGLTFVGQTHNLASLNLATSASILTASGIGQIHALASSNLATNAAVIGQSAIVVVTPIISVDVTTFTPTINSTTLTQTHSLNSGNLVTTASALSITSISQTHVLASQGLATAAPALSTASMGQTHVLGAVAVVSGVPVVSAASLGQTHILTSANLQTFSPIITVTNLGGIGQLLSQNVVTSAPQISITGIGQKHAINSNNISGNSPVIETSQLGLIYNINSLPIASNIPIISTTSIAQIHALNSANIVAANPVISQSNISPIYVLHSADIATSSPEISLAFITELAQAPLVSQDIATFVPTISQSLINQYPDTPADRILTIEYENRIMIVASDVGSAMVDSGRRTLIVPFENRTIIIR